MTSLGVSDLARKRQLVEALLACNCMQTPQSRNQIIGELPPEIGHRIKRFPGGKQDVTSIVNACADFRGVIEALAEIVKNQEVPYFEYPYSDDDLGLGEVLRLLRIRVAS